MKTIFLGSLIFLFGCHAQVPPSHPDMVDERLWNAVTAFEFTFGVEVNMPVLVEDLSHLDRFNDGFPTYGKCPMLSRTRSVSIDPRALNRGYEFLEMRVFHELGHCVFNLPHVPEPCSIMRDHGASDDFVRQYRQNRQCFIEHMRGLIE